MSGPDPLELPAPVLDEALSRLVGEEAEARQRALAELIASHPEHRDGLHALHATLMGANRVLARTYAPPEPADPTHIDRYRILRRLGEGAFGVVYLCEQHEPIRRQVAIKLLRPGAGDRSTLLRFDSERRFLARLNHPAIAQISDAGLLPDGRPWFVMEYVPGVPITQYCDRGQLPIETRLSLFSRLCQGVQHAHEQGIVHRDLKPANVLVVEIDGEAQPKIIDFGIAKALACGDAAAAVTETGRVVGTPGYMSPEQAAGRLDEVDARSDLWSLGVLLYELLTGELPWGRGPGGTDSDPPLPSRRVATGTQGTGIAQQRCTQPRRLVRHLRGDLDWIVSKALSRERSRRYASALELAADLQRHLRGETVSAGPPSLAYRLRKFARRRRTTLLAGAVVTLVVAGGWWLVGAYRAEARSRGQDAEAAVANLLARANDDSLVDEPRTEAVRKTLAEDALAFYDQFLRDRPGDLASREGRARTLWTLSQVHWLLGQYGRSAETAGEAVADAEALLATAPANVTWRRLLANAERNLGRATFSLGRQPAAREHFQRAVTLFERCLQDEPGVAVGLLVRAIMELRSTLDPAAEAAAIEELLRRACELQEGIVRRYPDHASERTSMAQLDLQRAQGALARGDVATAKGLFQRVGKWLAEGVELSPFDTFSARQVLGQIAAAEGDLTTALAHEESAVAACRAWIASEPAKPQPLFQLSTMLPGLAEMQRMASRPAERLQTWRAAVQLGETWVDRFPEDPRAPQYLVLSIHTLNMALLESGRRGALEGAERMARRAREVVAKLPAAMLAQRRQWSWHAFGGLGLVADALGLADAGAVWDETAAAMADCRAMGPLPRDQAAVYLHYLLRLARRHLDAGRPADAELAAAAELVDQYQNKGAACESYAPDLARLRALAAIQRGDLTAAAVAAESASDASDFRAAILAAEAMSAVWRSAPIAGADRTRWRDRASELCRQAIAVLEGLGPEYRSDPWVFTPLARLQILVALAQRDALAAVDDVAIEQALSTLLRTRDEVHANEWDEGLFTAGKALLAH